MLVLASFLSSGVWEQWGRASAVKFYRNFFVLILRRLQWEESCLSSDSSPVLSTPHWYTCPFDWCHSTSYWTAVFDLYHMWHFLWLACFSFFFFFFYRKSVWLRICISLSSSLSSSRTLGPRLPCPCRKCEDAITPLLTCLRGFQMFKKSLQENCLLIICR